MKVTLIESPNLAGMLCGDAAAICTSARNARKALRHALVSGHTSVLEHAVYTFRVDGISRVTLAQLTRHRIASFSVRSQRYVGVDDEDLIIPKSVRESIHGDEAVCAMRYLMDIYQRLVEDGVPCEDARYITLQAVTTSLILTMNARELLHFFSLRTCNRAQWEIRHLADEMLRLCMEDCPEIFRHAGPGCVVGTCPERKPCGHPRHPGEWSTPCTRCASGGCTHS